MPTGKKDEELSAFHQPSPFDGNERRQDVVDLLEGKKGKTDVNYMSADKREGENQDAEVAASCEACGNYLSPGEPTSKCAVVMGTVEADGICDMFDPQIAGQGDLPAGAGELL